MPSTVPSASPASEPLTTPWASSTAEVADTLDTDIDNGLGSTDAVRRLAEDGPNELPREVARPA